MNASFLPSLPFEQIDPLLYGVLLVAGILGGEIARALKLPRMIGYAFSWSWRRSTSARCSRDSPRPSP